MTVYIARKNQMTNWLYKIGVYKILYYVGRGICWTTQWVCKFGSTLKWLWLGRQLQELITETLADLSKGCFQKAFELPEYEISRLYDKENNGK